MGSNDLQFDHFFHLPCNEMVSTLNPSLVLKTKHNHFGKNRHFGPYFGGNWSNFYTYAGFKYQGVC